MGWSCFSTSAMATHLSGRGENILSLTLDSRVQGRAGDGIPVWGLPNTHTTSEDNNLSLPLTLGSQDMELPSQGKHVAKAG